MIYKNTGTWHQVLFCGTFAALHVLPNPSGAIADLARSSHIWFPYLTFTAILLLIGATRPNAKCRQAGLILATFFWASYASEALYRSVAYGTSFSYTAGILFVNLTIMGLWTYKIDVWRKPRCEKQQ